MKSHPSAPGTAIAEQAEAARRDPVRAKPAEYKLQVSYYCTMKAQRVYPLVVEVPRGKGAVAAEAPTGIVVLLRPVVPGALVAPAELPLEVSRPGAQATFHVTPLARGRLPAARVRVLCDGRPVQELPARMVVKNQRLAWALLLLALVVPPLLAYYTNGEGQLRGLVIDQRMPAPKVGEPEVPASEGGKALDYLRPGLPGEVLKDRLGRGLHDNVPDFSGCRRVCGLAVGAGAVYGALCWVAKDFYPAFSLGVLLLVMAFCSWVLHRPTRVRVEDLLALSGPFGRMGHTDQTAETLPLAPPE
jgi:hypothetical protein